MSSRRSSERGTLAARVAQTDGPQPRSPWCLVDGVFPGVVAVWTNVGGEWQALVSYVKDGELRSATLPARRLTPH